MGHLRGPSVCPAFGCGGVGPGSGQSSWPQALGTTGDVAFSVWTQHWQQRPCLELEMQTAEPGLPQWVGRQSAARGGGVGGEARWVVRPAGPPEAKREGTPCPLPTTCSVPGSNLHPSCCPCPAASWEGAFYPSFQCNSGRSPGPVPSLARLGLSGVGEGKGGLGSGVGSGGGGRHRGSRCSVWLPRQPGPTAHGPQGLGPGSVPQHGLTAGGWGHCLLPVRCRIRLGHSQREPPLGL